YEITIEKKDEERLFEIDWDKIQTIEDVKPLFNIVFYCLGSSNPHMTEKQIRDFGLQNIVKEYKKDDK
ncbi:hypothetical protein, partial [Tepidiforma sp.]|uniref:hypothetical protein n=1 Tax=Tepidiforma sp. TaxID=2682230 RepID=UPI002613592D